MSDEPITVEVDYNAATNEKLYWCWWMPGDDNSESWEVRQARKPPIGTVVWAMCTDDTPHFRCKATVILDPEEKHWTVLEVHKGTWQDFICGEWVPSGWRIDAGW